MCVQSLCKDSIMLNVKTVANTDNIVHKLTVYTLQAWDEKKVPQTDFFPNYSNLSIIHEMHIFNAKTVQNLNNIE